MRVRMPNVPRVGPKTDCLRCQPLSTSSIGAVSTLGFLLVVGARKGRATGFVGGDAWLVSAATAMTAAGAAGSFVPSLVPVVTGRPTAAAALPITGRISWGVANRQLDGPGIRSVHGGVLSLVGSSGRADSWK
jgi:hypothetical protein